MASMKTGSRSSWSGKWAFILAAAASAVGLGNMWRFPYLAAKEGGGIFLLVYLILVLTFGFTLLTTEIAIGRLTRQGPLTAYGRIHAGWRGTAAGIAAKAAEKMVRELGCRPENIRAAVGPCIGPCCFETDADVPEAMLAALGAEAEACIRPAGEKFYVDLKELNAIWLRRAGVTQIDVSAECTCCRPERFWSHRRVGGHRGSLAAIIAIKEGTL